MMGNRFTKIKIKKKTKFKQKKNNKMNNNKNKNKNKIEICPCGDPLNNHKQSCSLYCGMYPCEDDMVKLPQCQHFMHQQCLERLLYIRLSCCPLCRSSINTIRTSKHYQVIEKEISLTFQNDTQQAIRLSLQLINDNNNNNNS